MDWLSVLLTFLRAEEFGRKYSEALLQRLEDYLVSRLLKFSLCFVVVFSFSGQADGQSKESELSLPKPTLSLKGIERVLDFDGDPINRTRYLIQVDNWRDFSPELFVASPDLPAIGRNKSASRTRVSILNERGKHIYGYVGFNNPKDLTRMSLVYADWQMINNAVIVEITDRRTGHKVRSEPLILADEALSREASCQGASFTAP